MVVVTVMLVLMLMVVMVVKVVMVKVVMVFLYWLKYFRSKYVQRTVSPARTDDLPSTEVSLSSGLGVSDQSLSYASWLLRYMAENLESYVNSADYLDLDYVYHYDNSTIT